MKKYISWILICILVLTAAPAAALAADGPASSAEAVSEQQTEEDSSVEIPDQPDSAENDSSVRSGADQEIEGKQDTGLSSEEAGGKASAADAQNEKGILSTVSLTVPEESEENTESGTSDYKDATEEKKNTDEDGTGQGKDDTGCGEPQESREDADTSEKEEERSSEKDISVSEETIKTESAAVSASADSESSESGNPKETESGEAEETEDTWSGKGTAADPYLLKKTADLELLRDKVNAGETFSGKVFKMTADIALPSGWVPVGCLKPGASSGGNGRNICPFCGTFDGGGRQLTIPSGGMPLFGYVRGSGHPEY